MKRLIIPIVVALLAGIGGGSGYAYMSSSPVVADSAKHADSTSAGGDSAAAHLETPADIAIRDSVHRALHPADLPPGADSVQHGAPLPLTPADSIRAMQAARGTIKGENKGAGTKAPVSATNGATASTATASTATANAAATNTAAGTAKSGAASGRVPAVAPATAATSAALSSALPEQRLAKIFGAMQAKDAGRVLEQMTDSDIRTVLGMMSDRQAAAILATLTPQRAAAITRGSVRGAGSLP